MSRLARITTASVTVAAATVLVTAGVAMASTASGRAGGAVLGPKVVPISHQLCYTATGKGFKIPKRIILVNELSPKGFAPKVGAVAIHCNPVQKTLPSGAVYKIINPAAHLLCFTITTTKQPQHLVFASNQFGVADLNVSQPNLLCLPSWKRLTGPPRQKQPQPPGLDHFTCYPVTVQQGGYRPPGGIRLQDEFASKPVAVKIIRTAPVELCVPTKKIVGTHVTKITNPAMHLLCFSVTATPTKPKVYDKNQFGSGVVGIRHTNWLCLPTTTTVIR
jgi:hypothetical protein